MHTLITFLGRVPKSEGGYRKTRYHFPDGSETAETAFFGWALAQRLRPDRLIILGTSGSMWEYLSQIPALAGLSDQDHLALLDATEHKLVDQALLDRVIAARENTIGPELRLEIIPYCRTQAEQVQLLGAMARHVPPDSAVSLDVTHGFRHLPMLALISALHLRMVRRAEIRGFHYGAYDPDTGEASVFELGGLLHIADWLNALHAFDKDGDYGVFADLLEADGLSETETAQLRRSAFLERTSNAYLAQKSLRTFTQSVTRERFAGAARLFADELEQRLGWHKGGDLYRWQSTLARQYLQRGDYIRATIFGYEAFVTRLIEPSESDWDYLDREQAFKAYENGERGPNVLKEDYFTLKNLRNALAHGNRPKDNRIARIAEDPQRLPAELKRLLNRLLDRR